MRRALALLLALTATASLLTACGEDQTTAASDTPTCGQDQATGATDTTGNAAETAVSDPKLDDVKITGAEGEQPVLEFDKPLGVAETATKVISKGDGTAIKVGSTASFDFLFVNATDGNVVGTSYDSDPVDVPFEDSLLTGIYKGLDGQKAGSRVLVGIAPKDGPGADSTSGLTDTDSLLFLVDIHDVRFPLQRAEGTAVPPVAGLPTVTLADDGAPTITVPEGDPPAELVVQPLIEGACDVVESGQTITVNYTGVLYDDGTEFDSSWSSGSPASFPIGTGGVIPGWDKGLVGQHVGSQVLLVIPAADGYGDTGSGDTIPPGATLVFVVDILDAH